MIHLRAVNINKIDYRLVGLKHQVGARPDEFSRILAFNSIKKLSKTNKDLDAKQATLVEPISFLATEVSQHSMSDNNIELMHKWRQEPPVSKLALSSNIKWLSKNMRLTYTKKTANMSSTITSLETKMRGLQTDRRLSTTPAPTPAQVGLSNLQRKITELETVLKQYTNLLELGQVISNGIVITGRGNLETIV